MIETCARPARLPSDPCRVRLGSLSALVLLAPLLLYLYPAVASLFSKSAMPWLFGRWSLFLAISNAWNIALLVAIGLALWRGSRRLLAACYLLLILSTFAVHASRTARDLPAIQFVLPAIRLLAGVALVALSFQEFRRTRRPLPLALAAGVFAVMLTGCDYVLLAITLTRSEQGGSGGPLREPYDLNAIRAEDLILVGDSFVWGQGVQKSERFGDQLDALWAEQGKRQHVYSLGVIGCDVNGYIEILSRIPAPVRAQRVVLCFYLNDMPPVYHLRDKVHDLLVGARFGCPSLGFAGDQLGKCLTRTVDDYHAYLVSCLDPTERTFATRWRHLEGQLRQVNDLAAAHSIQPPGFVIIPIMVDFHDYPLNQTHQDLTRLAQQLGFEPFDLLPIFRQELGHGAEYLAGPNDNHFDARTHRLVARQLARWLTAAGPSQTR